MSLDLSQQARELEESHPQSSLVLYDRLEEENRMYYPDILLVAIVCPILASIIAFFTSHSVAQHRTIVTLLILAVQGYGPAPLVFYLRESRRSFGDNELAVGLAYLQVSLIFVGSYFTLIFLIIVTLILVLPILAVTCLVLQLYPTELPLHISLLVIIPAFVVALAVTLTRIDRSIFPSTPFQKALFPFKFRNIANLIAEVPIALKMEMKQILEFLTGLAIGAVLIGTGPLGLLYNHLYESIAASGFAGVMLGLSLFHVERNLRTASEIRLGQIRCLIRLNRRAEARYRLKQLSDSAPAGRTPDIENVAQALSLLAERNWGRRPVPDLSYQLHRHLSRAADYGTEAWFETVRATRSLTHLEEGAEPVKGIPAEILEPLMGSCEGLALEAAAEHLYSREPKGKGPIHRRLREYLLQVMRNPVRPAWKRVAAGNALEAVGDPRCRADLWYLPDETLLGFVEIPAGQFLMGEGSRLRKITLPTYYIARYHVTGAQFQAFMKDAQYEPFLPPKGVGSHPVWFVGVDEVARYCRWLMKKFQEMAEDRVANMGLSEAELRFWKGLLERQLVLTFPSEAEWEKAARGTDGRRFPWGQEADPNRVNCWETGIGETSVVGCFSDGASPYGVEEMGGNLQEITRSKYGGFLDDPTHVLRGSGWNLPVEAGRCAARRKWEATGGAQGFRLVVSTTE